MYDAETKTVTLLCDNYMMKTVIDRFGSNVQTYIVSSNQFEATVDVSVSPTFFGWIVGCGGKIKIIAPEDVKTEYQGLLRKLVDENK